MEGQLLTLDASLLRDPDGDPLRYRWDFDSDGIWEIELWSIPTYTHVWTDDFHGTATVEVSDGELTATAVAGVTVNNVAPTITNFNIDSTLINVGGTVALGGTFTDPGTLDTHQVVVHWNDGSDDTVVNLDAGQYDFTASHQYTQAGRYSIEVTVSDNDGGEAQAAWRSPSTIRRRPCSSEMFSSPAVFPSGGALNCIEGGGGPERRPQLDLVVDQLLRARWGYFWATAWAVSLRLDAQRRLPFRLLAGDRRFRRGP